MKKITTLIKLTTICIVLLQATFANAQWQKINGIDDGVNCLTTDGSNIFAGSNNKGMFLTTNSGSSWAAVNTGLPANTSIKTIAISGSNIFAGTNGGLFLSSNNGSSWSVNSGKSVNALAISGSNIFMGTGAGGTGGVYLSTNNGSTWTSMGVGLPTNQGVDALTINGSKIFAATGTGVYESANNGSLWSKNNSLPYIQNFAVSGSNIFAGTLGSGIYLSTNNGGSWAAMNTGLTNSYIESLAISGSNILAGTRDGVFLSTNNGSLWTAFSSGLPTKTTIKSILINSSTIFIGTSTNGIWKQPLLSLGVIEEGREKGTISIYPNPATNELTITSISPIEKTEVYNLTGVIQNTFFNKNTIDILTLHTGIYFIKVYSENGIYIQKFVKQ
jgi:hypothetical protein